MTTEKTVDLRFSACFIEMLITDVLVGEDGHMQPRDATIWGCRKLCDNGLADDEARKLDGVPDLPLITNFWCVLRHGCKVLLPASANAGCSDCSYITGCEGGHGVFTSNDGPEDLDGAVEWNIWQCATRNVLRFNIHIGSLSVRPAASPSAIAKAQDAAANT